MTDYWPTAESDPAATPAMREVRAHLARQTEDRRLEELERVDSNGRLVRDDAVAEVTRLRAQHGFDMSVGGPTTASTFLRAGLIDEVRLFVNPVVLGAGRPFFPPLDTRVGLELLETRMFDAGVVYLRYKTSGPAG
jgi:dihydrofolate reductase